MKTEPHVWLSWEYTSRLYPSLEQQQTAYVSLTGESYELLWLLSIAAVQTRTDLNFGAQHSALQGIRVEALCFFFFLSLPRPLLPIFCLLPSISATCCPSIVLPNTEADKLMASRGWVALFVCTTGKIYAKNCFTSKLLFSFEDVLKNEHCSGI